MAKLGKIEPHLFDAYISGRCGAARPEVIAGPQFGVDVALVDLPAGMAMALTSDPLSLIPSLGLQESAWLSVQLMANDMATTGFAPQYGQFVLNLPATFSKNDFKTYWQHIDTFCKEIGIAITGGHTGFIEGQNSTIAGGGTFITVAPKDEILLSKYAQPGDAILVTKSAALSASAILALSFPETVKNKAGAEVYQKACASFYDTSCLKDALTAKSTGYITAMHDVTEGGVLGAIYEMASASGHGAVVYADRLPVDSVQSAVCRVFGLDPKCCIGAGALVITCKKANVSSVIKALGKEGIACTEVGEVVPVQQGITRVDGGVPSALTYQEEDPYWAAFFNAYKNGWK
ncbi:AIR synthase-related protein [Flavobacterium akiainvivens]|nr:AIR synthase-related protein [Flavobacterium akiainvivens]SFQ34900.1 Hydrogenase maturation factor [Flavobacterium akiainvivens]